MLAPRRWLMALLVVILLSGGGATLHAHQDRGHRLHSCPSDHHTDEVVTPAHNSAADPHAGE